ncbi:hypothetical protein AVEN_210464-1 [Araneus ventricosus]|uniref:Uncharacterized protein n=1 Tax=Araneus ventricosus TaxID=182803 RepID=A0A4Y2HT01_ARAVE|nr:hypothetical protein AVEN_210464-1 [Araneus ventricosus]
MMASCSCITIPILLAKIKNCCKSSNGKSRATPYDTDLAPNLDSKHLSGTKFSSDNDVKTAAENWLNGQGRHFYQPWLNKVVRCSDKYQIRFGDYVEK